MLKMRFGLSARIGLYERIRAFLENNIDIVSTLISIRDRYKKGKDPKYKILNEWIAVMNQGGKFADAIQPWVPAAEHMLISAGEKGQGLIKGLEEATVLSTASSKNKSNYRWFGDSCIFNFNDINDVGWFPVKDGAYILRFASC